MSPTRIHSGAGPGCTCSTCQRNRSASCGDFSPVDAEAWCHLRTNHPGRCRYVIPSGA